MAPETQPLPVTHVDEPPVPVKIDKKALAKVQRQAEEKQIAQIRQQFNTRTMVVKTKLLAQAGVQIEKWGVKNQGHGRLYCAGDNADRAIAAIEEDIKRVSESNAPKAVEVVAHLRMVQWRFNKQIIEVGEAHLDAAKEVGGKPVLNTQIVFPAGQKLVMAVTPAVAPVNDKEKALTQGEGGP